jgi:hypothetical protein
MRRVCRVGSRARCAAALRNECPQGACDASCCGRRRAAADAPPHLLPLHRAPGLPRSSRSWPPSRRPLAARPRGPRGEGRGSCGPRGLGAQWLSTARGSSEKRM